MFGKLDNPQIEKLLSENFIGRIGCHADDKTYVVPISYVYDGNCIYSHAYEGLKISMLRQNPEVCFQVDKMENMANWESVITWGTFKELTDAEERKAGVQKLVDRALPKISSETVKLSPQWPFPPDDLNMIKGIIFKICLHEKTGRFEYPDPQIF